MSGAERLGDLPVFARQEPVPERGDAARNRALLLEAARRLIARSGADAITMDDVAAAAGVGKGTLFRRFGSRAGLMMVLLDEDERASQQAFLFGPPPLGPDAPPLDRLIAFGRERMRFVHAHHQLLSEANRDPQTRHSAALSVLRTHLRLLRPRRLLVAAHVGPTAGFLSRSQGLQPILLSQSTFGGRHA